MVQRECPQCHKMFWRRESSLALCCSHECAKQYEGWYKVCKACRIEFRGKYHARFCLKCSQIAKNIRAKKAKERNRQWRAKHPDYPKEWRAKHPGYFRRWRKENERAMQKYQEAYRATGLPPKKVSPLALLSNAFGEKQIEAAIRECLK